MEHELPSDSNVEFDEDYYERGVETGKSLYQNYRWIPELTIPLAATLCEQLGIEEGQRVVDFGCAKGYLVRALRLLHRKAFGVEVSSYALAQAPADVRGLIAISIHQFEPPVDWIIAKDVLEHMLDEDDLMAELRPCFNAADHMFVIVPLGTEAGEWVIPQMANDVTHRICKPLEWWYQRLLDAGWGWVSGTTRFAHVKEHWPVGGHGFFVCHKEGL